MRIGSARFQRSALIGIFALALAVRVGAVFLFGLSDITTNNESVVIASNLAQGRGFAFDFFGARPTAPLLSFMPPLYPFWVAVYLRYFPQPALALELSQAFLSSLTVLLMYIIALNLSSSRAVGLLTALGVAIYPPFAIMSGYPVTVTVNTCLLALFLVVSLWLWTKMTVIRATLTGVVLGCLILTRPAALGLLPGLIVWLCFATAYDRRNKILAAGLVAAVTFITLLPWIIRNYQVQGQFVFISTNGGFAFWQGSNPFTAGNGFEVDSQRLAQFLNRPYDPSQPRVIHLMPYVLPNSIQQQLSTIKEPDLDRALLQAGWDFLRDNPGRGLELVLAKLQALWWFGGNAGTDYDSAWLKYYTLLYAALLITAIPGIALSLRRRRHYLMVYYLFVYFTLTYVAFNGQVRYRWEIEPYLIMFAAVMFVQLYPVIGARALKPVSR